MPSLICQCRGVPNPVWVWHERVLTRHVNSATVETIWHSSYSCYSHSSIGKHISDDSQPSQLRASKVCNGCKLSTKRLDLRKSNKKRWCMLWVRWRLVNPCWSTKPRGFESCEMVGLEAWGDNSKAPAPLKESIGFSKRQTCRCTVHKMVEVLISKLFV